MCASARNMMLRSTDHVCKCKERDHPHPTPPPTSCVASTPGEPPVPRVKRYQYQIKVTDVFPMVFLGMSSSALFQLSKNVKSEPCHLATSNPTRSAGPESLLKIFHSGHGHGSHGWLAAGLGLARTIGQWCDIDAVVASQ